MEQKKETNNKEQLMEKTGFLYKIIMLWNNPDAFFLSATRMIRSVLLAFLKSPAAYLTLAGVSLSVAGIFYAEDILAQSGSELTEGKSDWPWWIWPILLFLFTFTLGILAVAAGVGGGVLFVPIVSSIFPFHLDFVRGAGLLVALTGALSAGPGLLRKGLADLRLAIPMALMASTSSIFGAMVGLALPTWLVQIFLGSTILFIVLIMTLSKKSDFPDVKESDKLSKLLGISGTYHEESENRYVHWQIHRTPQGMVLFLVIGFLAGMFGLGAGFANVPVLNLVLGAPLKISVATSVFILSITDTAAGWVYLNKGAIIPLIAVPSVAGMMLGTRIGVKVLTKAKPKAIKIFVITFLSLAGLRALIKGIGAM